MNLKAELNINNIYNKWIASIDGFTHQGPDIFATLSSDEDRVSFVFNLLKKTEPKLFINNIGKTKLISKDYREDGNKRYASFQFKESIEQYTKSIAFAPPDSQELILALGNRAASCLNTGNIPEALVDVQRALEMPNIEEDYKLKLEKRKDVCINRIIESKEQFKLSDLPQINHKSPFFDSASDKVLLNSSKELGRFLTAREDISTCEVLVVEKPYSFMLIPAVHYTNCNYCFLRYPALVECGHCTWALYCSTECLKKDKKKHSYICSIMERLIILNIHHINLLALKTLIEALCEGNNLKDLKSSSNDIYRSNDLRRCYDLVGNTELRSPLDLFKRTFTACVMVQALNQFSNIFQDFKVSEIIAGGFILHFLQSLPCNAHGMYEPIDGEYVEIGAGLYATLSLTNHSCDPNVVRQTVGPVSILRSIRPIKKGEEILDNYGFHYAIHNLAERKSSLMDQYYFECQCEACVNNWPLYQKLPYLEPVFKTDLTPNVLMKFKKLSETFLANLKDVVAKKQSIKILISTCEYLDFLDSNIERPWKYYNDCQETVKNCLDVFPTFKR